MNVTSTPTQTPSPIAGLEPTLPTAWYRSEEAFRTEKERIFWREWMCVGREEELPGAGAYRVLDIAGESIIVVRNPEGVLRGFYNVCRHRGTRLCHSADVQAQGRSEFRSGVVAGRRIVCPYHQRIADRKFKPPVRTQPARNGLMLSPS